MLEAERQEMQTTIERDYVKNWRKRHWVQALFVFDSVIIQQMPGYMHMWKEHRTNDEAVLTALCALASAAVQQGPYFTVEVTADDFRLLHKFYRGAPVE
jgi:hypothetical protein